jgi:hypothetical protein
VAHRFASKAGIVVPEARPLRLQESPYTRVGDHIWTCRSRSPLDAGEAYPNTKDENSSTFRSRTAVAADVGRSVDGMRHSRVRHDGCGACLLPHDAQSMRSGGNARLPGLLREGSACSFRKCLEVQVATLPPGGRAGVVGSVLQHIGKRQR